MTVRDADRFKDKIEVSLDSRQIFFLFFGGAVLACLVFVLGVMVGKRLEQRERVAHKPATSAAVDPLAALDELGADEAKPDDLAFPSALAGEDRGREVIPSPAPPPKPEPVAAKAPAPKPEPVAAKPEPVAAKVEPVAPKPDPGAGEPKKKYTLQISSFQDKNEAEALMSRLTASGYKPFVVQSNVPDKGTFYRVRIGEFGSKQDASSAKSDFEKKQHLLAYVTKI